MTDRQRLHQLLLDLSLQRGEFTLASGRTSSYYLDCRRTTLHPEGAWLVAAVILDCIAANALRAEAIGGLTLGADPIAAAVAAVSHHQGRPLPAFIVRKASKDHGTRRRIEGATVAGKTVIVVDDVVTTAESTLEAIGAVREAGGVVSAAICLVDREEGGTERLADLPFYPIFRRRDLLGE
jgi:orotate phosphoribosyltransferase